ncbi:MAG: amidohydrolase [Deltaproteobacteria bacterium]|nr:amidohydrolase [Deltaproteobacteria bacterium]
MIIDFRIIGTGEKFFMGGYEAMPPFMERYKKLYDFGRMCTLPVEELISQMVKSGISLAVLHAEYSYGDVEQLNRTVAETVKRFPDRLIGFAGIDPLASEDPVSDLDRYLNEWNMKGLNLQPWVQGWYPNDKRFYPLYSYCQQKKIPVAIHTSLNFSVNRKIDYGRPIYLDEIACDFPNLTIVANHGGWPWLDEMVAVAWKHPNLYLEIGGVSPKYISKPGTGWELFLTYGNSILQDQILFATDSLIPHDRVVKELDLLPLKDQVKEKFLYKNAMRILNLSSV